MIPGAGAAGIPSSPATPGEGSPPAPPPGGADTCKDCGALLSLSVKDYAPPHYGPRLCWACGLAEIRARSEAPDVASGYDVFISNMRRVCEAKGLQQMREWIKRGAVTIPAGHTLEEVLEGISFEWSSPQLKPPQGAGGPGQSL